MMWFTLCLWCGLSSMQFTIYNLFYHVTWCIQYISRLFCTGVYDCRRLLKIQYVIAIHLIRWLTNFYDFRFKWTATAGIGIHPTRTWLSQLVNFKNEIWTFKEGYAIKFCFKLRKKGMRWKLDLLLWPRDQETEFPVEACWLPQTQEGQTEQIYPQTFDEPFFWQHWHDLHALGSHWTDS